jgi:hypothetical protein
MDYISFIRNSVETSIKISLFKNKQESLFAHIYKSKLVKLPLTTFNNYNVDNFDSVRLQKSAVKAFPLNDRR